MEVKNNILFMVRRRWKFLSVYISSECAVCVRVMFNNHHNDFLVYTSQVWPDKKRLSQSYEFVVNLN